MAFDRIINIEKPPFKCCKSLEIKAFLHIYISTFDINTTHSSRVPPIGARPSGRKSIIGKRLWRHGTAWKRKDRGTVCLCWSLWKQPEWRWGNRGFGRINPLLQEQRERPAALPATAAGVINEATVRLKRPVFEEEKVEGLWGEVLMSAKTPKKDGKGYEYPVMGYMAGLEGTIREDRKKPPTFTWQ